MTGIPAQENCAHFTDQITVVVPFRWDRTRRIHVRAAATKSYQFDAGSSRWNKLSDYDEHRAVELIEQPCHDLIELAEIVQLVGDGNGYIVRGDLTDAARLAMDRDELTNRRKTAKHHNDQPGLREVARHWLMIDVDDWPIPPNLSLTDVDDHPMIVDSMIRELCGAEFHDADCWFQWSSSAGLLSHDTAKAHLWFWLDQAETNDHLRRYLMATMPGVDHAPFNAVQPHYVAPPLLVGGHDPLPARAGWRHDWLGERGARIAVAGSGTENRPGDGAQGAYYPGCFGWSGEQGDLR